MVKHIVLFQLSDDLQGEQRKQVKQDFRNGIMALPEVISFIRKIEVEFNVNPKEQYDIALYSEFDSLDDVKAYAVHPQHVEVAGIIRPYMKNRACVDYEIGE